MWIGFYWRTEFIARENEHDIVIGYVWHSWPNFVSLYENEKMRMNDIKMLNIWLTSERRFSVEFVRFNINESISFKDNDDQVMVLRDIIDNSLAWKTFAKKNSRILLDT